jgi:hypothetical protein
MKPMECVEKSDISTQDRCFEESLRDAQDRFDRQAFQFRHLLAEHPLFKIPRLVELVLSRPANEFYFDQGDAAIDQRWNSMPAKTLSLEQAIYKIEQAKAWIIINHAERDPQYRQLLDRALDEILAGSGLERHVKSREVIIFVSSPGRVTTYHIDRECNFLLQIAGDKTIYVFDRNDREILTEEEVEQFWSQDNNAAKYKPQYQERAMAFHLTPGTGVHIPVNCPHWVKNGDKVSVSVSINFQFHDRFRANIYRMNYLMRKAGLRPTPPGQAGWKDSLKGMAMTPLVEGRRMVRRVK